MTDTYRTIEGYSEATFRDRGSRFIARTYPVEEEEAIKPILDSLKKKYHDARHHCFAWRLGAEKNRYRINDDGEPPGSAGKPIYGQIVSRDLTNLLIVVTRYFGGTLLGVPGLINAYRSAASGALEGTRILTRRVLIPASLEFSYDAMDAVMRLVKELDLTVTSRRFDLSARLQLRIWIRQLDEVEQRVKRIHGANLDRPEDQNVHTL